MLGYCKEEGDLVGCFMIDTLVCQCESNRVGAVGEEEEAVGVEAGALDVLLLQTQVCVQLGVIRTGVEHAFKLVW